MIADREKKSELSQLVFLSLNDRLNEEQGRHLSELLRDSLLRNYYFELLEISDCLREIVWMRVPGGLLAAEEAVLSMDIWQILAREENTARALVTETDLIRDVEYEKGALLLRKERVTSKFSIYTLIASAAIFLLAIVFTRLAPPSDGVMVGTLTRTVDAQWASAAGDTVKDGPLRAGVLTLTKGLAEILLKDGATVILEAPVEVTLESSHQMYIAAGKAVASIQGENGKAFIIRSPYGTVIDYGTEFGVEIGSGEITTYVFQGNVALRDGDDPVKFSDTINLKAGEGGRVKQCSKPERNTMASEVFIRSKEFNIRLEASKGSRYHRWLEYSYKLRRDPNLVAYYTFEKDPNAPALITNQAGITKGYFNADMNGIPEQQRPTWIPGRWDQKEALQFVRQRKQHLRVKGGSELYQNGPITLAAWIKCPGIEDGSHIVSNRMENLGPCNYQFGYKIRRPEGYDMACPNMIQLARKAVASDGQQVYSPILDTITDWMFIAVTHDNHTVSFYRNGRLIQSMPWEIRQQAVAADLWIGSDGTDSLLDRFFNGALDELIILKRALNPNDIRVMYESGKP